MGRLVLAIGAIVLLVSACAGSASTDSESGGLSDAALADDGGLRVPTKGWRTDFSKHVVPLDEFWQAVPLKDGIPSLDEPSFTSVDEAAAWIEGLEPVIEVEIGGVARAYPLQIMIWHEIVNDVLGDVPIAVTFCPLCYTAVAFERMLDGRVYEFGVSGNLRNADLVMYDRQTESWWQQFDGQALVGELAGSTLKPVPATIVGFEDFAARHPDGQVLSIQTGYEKPYGLNPYPGYDRIDKPVTRVLANEDDRLPPKTRVVLLLRDGETVAVPFTALQERSPIEVELAGERLEVLWVDAVRSALGDLDIARADVVGSADVRSLETGERVPFDTPFWFAVAAFRPDARIVTS